MDKKTVFSIIIPVYKVEKYLRRCLNSVCAQAYPELQVIVVDDGSPDNCPVICDEYAAKDSRITVIHQPNGGLSAARNAGIASAEGEWILFLDSDDYIEPEFFNTLDRYIAPEIDILGFGYAKCGKQNSTSCKNTGELKVFEPAEGVREMIRYGCFSHMIWDKAYRRSLFKSFAFIKGRLAEDLPASAELMCKSRKAAYLDRVLYWYYIREGSITGNVSPVYVQDVLKGEQELNQKVKETFPMLQNDADDRLYKQSMKMAMKLRQMKKSPEVSVILQTAEDYMKSIPVVHLTFAVRLLGRLYRFCPPLAGLLYMGYHRIDS